MRKVKLYDNGDVVTIETDGNIDVDIGGEFEEYEVPEDVDITNLKSLKDKRKQNRLIKVKNKGRIKT